MPTRRSSTVFEGQYLHYSGSAYAVYSPWFPRGGQNAIFTIDVVAIGGAGALVVEAFTKNSEETGAGSDADSAVDLSGSAVGEKSATWKSTDVKGFKELVRYKFNVSGENAGDWILFRMLPPVWFDNVRA